MVRVGDVTDVLDEADPPRPPVATRMLGAAVEAFAELGFHVTTTREIAAKVGLSPAAVYVHCRSKEELL